MYINCRKCGLWSDHTKVMRDDLCQDCQGEWDDKRMDAIGQNGNDGAGYCNGNCRTNGEHLERHAQGIGCVNSEEFTKHDGGKIDFSLVPVEVIEALAEQLHHGAKKYKRDNWKLGSTDRYYAALMRHLMAWRRGERHDEEGLPHLQAVLCNASFLYYLTEV